MEKYLKRKAVTFAQGKFFQIRIILSFYDNLILFFDFLHLQSSL